MPRLVHVYHCWLSGEWRRIASWHLRHLHDSGFSGQVLVSLVGTPDDRAAARDLFRREVLTEADMGFEEVTLNALRQYVRNLPGDVSVLYAHDKGALNCTPENRLWSLYLTEHLVDHWEARVRELESNDISAWSWLPADTIDPFGRPIGGPVPAGNFWWATAGYLRGLPELPPLTASTRFDAEWWVGQDSPTVACASQAWPVLNFTAWSGGGSVGGMRQPARQIPNPDFGRCW